MSNQDSFNCERKWCTYRKYYFHRASCHTWACNQRADLLAVDTYYFLPGLTTLIFPWRLPFWLVLLDSAEETLWFWFVSPQPAHSLHQFSANASSNIYCVQAMLICVCDDHFRIDSLTLSMSMKSKSSLVPSAPPIFSVTYCNYRNAKTCWKSNLKCHKPFNSCFSERCFINFDAVFCKSVEHFFRIELIIEDSWTGGYY